MDLPAEAITQKKLLQAKQKYYWITVGRILEIQKEKALFAENISFGIQLLTQFRIPISAEKK